MSEPVKFDFTLTDLMSGPASRIDRSLSKLETDIDKTEKRAKSLEVEFGRLSAAGSSLSLDKFASGAAGGAFTLGISEGVSVLVEGFKSAYELAEKIVEKVVEFGADAIKAAAGAEKLHLGQDLLLGKPQADVLRKYTEAIAGKGLGMDDDAIAQALQPLLLSGVRGKILQHLTAAAGDVEVLTSGSTKFADALAVFQRVQTTGKLDPRAARGLGLQVSEVFGILGKTLGMSPEAALKQAKSGKLNPDTLLSTLFAAIADKTGEGLGGAAAKGAQTVDAKLRRLKELPENYLKTIAESGGYASFSSFLDRILEKLDPTGPTGQRIIAGLTTLADKILGLLDGIDSDTINEVVDGMLSFGNAILSAVPFVQILAHEVGVLVGWMKDAWDLSKKLNGPLLDLMNYSFGQFTGGDEGKRQRYLAAIQEQHDRDVVTKGTTDAGSQVGAQIGGILAPSGLPGAGAGVRSMPVNITFGNIQLGQGSGQEQATDFVSTVRQMLPSGLSGAVDHHLEAVGG